MNKDLLGRLTAALEVGSKAFAGISEWAAQHGALVSLLVAVLAVILMARVMSRGYEFSLRWGDKSLDLRPADPASLHLPADSTHPATHAEHITEVERTRRDVGAAF